jgi:RimJ/RimL family protein N-acetyltransferase
MIRDVDASNLAAVREFLEAHVETSLFLLGNLAELGTRLGKHLNSGNFRVLCEAEAIVAVFCLTRRGNLLLQTGGREDLGASILGACRAEPMPVQGVIGEWRATQSVWQLLCADPGFAPGVAPREVFYGRDLPFAPDATSTLRVRSLLADDFDQWNLVNAAYSAEVHLPVQGTREERHAMFSSQADRGYWWGYFDGGELIATASLNASYGRLGQVGGVYTRPGYRGRGLARLTLEKAMHDAWQRHRLERLILFTGEHNRAARALYESLGFVARGHFGLLFGTPGEYRNPTSRTSCVPSA